jgi:small subunit ribosomal protein S17
MTKILTGKVIETKKMLQTVTVEITSFRRHPLYKKKVKKSRKVLAQLEGLEVEVGDLVEIGETRPISKNKHFKVLGVKKGQ